jgi:hypothetical protein
MKFRVLLALLAIPLSSCGAPFYTAEPIQAWVVDAETNQPIEGAIVVANWQLVRGGLDGPRYQGQLEVKEVVTDKAGRFDLEGFTKPNPTLAELRNEDPRILIFKAGYEYKIFSNNYPGAGTQTPGTRRRSSVDGKTIRLERLKPLVVAGRDTFYLTLSIKLENIMKNCGWKEIPKLVTAMDQGNRELKALHPQADIGLLTILGIEAEERPNCR